MLKDECIVVDEHDSIIGHGNKYDCHRFVPGQPHGKLHRAFSVFLFSSDNKLLLQQRAPSKITFPSVWTNTCCSHPLYSQAPEEVDSDEQLAAGSVPGIKAGAVRKLQQELGIEPAALPASSFKYLTRLHYCAPDSVTWGPDSPWGEHEIDYILLARADVALAPNPEEVQAVKYVTQQELAEMMDPGSGLLWSPWFRLIAQHLLPAWWQDLHAALSSSKHDDFGTIHKLSC
jgi:isopentenyl-diphosphate delta-isomerase